MPEPESTTILTPTDNANNNGNYMIQVKDVDPLGATSSFNVPLATTSDWAQWSLPLRIAVLKKTLFKSLTIPEIAFGVMYADRMGLDIAAGDVYNIDGKWNTSNGAKIKHAMKSGKIGGYEVELRPVMNGGVTVGVAGHPKTFTVKRKLFGKETDVVMDEMEAHVTVDVVGWAKPVKYSSKLSQWAKGSNPNWIDRPDYMLRLNALAHALHEICPIGVDADEAPADANGQIAVPDMSDVTKVK